MTTEAEPTLASRRILVPALIVSVVLAGIAVGFLLMTVLNPSGRPSAGADTSATPSAMQTTNVAPTASSTGSPSAQPTADPLRPDTMASVTVDDLNVRVEPSSTARSLGHVSAGARVFALAGPEQANGFGWYRVVTTEHLGKCSWECRGSVGWIAGISDVGERWLVPADLNCPTDPTLAVFGHLAPFERLACYGHQTLRLDGTDWNPCCGYVGAVMYEPAWLSWPSSEGYLNWHDHLAENPGGLMLRFKPRDNLPRPEYADIVRVTGHLDDPAAHNCSLRVDESALDQDPPIVIDPDDLSFAPIGCRTEFVVDTIEIVGNTGEECVC